MQNDSSRTYINGLNVRLLSSQPDVKPLLPRARQNDINVSEEEKPDPYFGSQAASWQASRSRSGNQRGDSDVPGYQVYLTSGSLAAFLIYFCILREESDIDQKFDKHLFEHVPDLEVVELRRVREHNIVNNLPIAEIDKRLKDLGIIP